MAIDPWEMVLRLTIAAIAGMVVGLEREARGRTAGLRTHAIVALGAALFTTAGAYGFTEFARSSHDPARVAAQVAAGVGFIGAGAILRHGAAVVGITTAASIWLSAALGVAAGAGAYVAVVTSIVLTMLLLVVLHAGKSLSHRIGSATTIVEVEYDRGHGTLGPLLRGLESLNGRVESLSIEDDDGAATGAGRRRVVVRIVGPKTAELRASLGELAQREEVHCLSLT